MKQYSLDSIFKDKIEENEFLKLGDIIKISSGNSKNENGNFPLYGSTGLIGTTSAANYTGEFNLIARVGVNTGYNYFVNLDNAGITDNTLIMQSNEKYLKSKFLHYFFTKYNLNKLAFGSGQSLITSIQIKNIKINLPGIEIQNKYVKLLSSMDELIELLNKELESLIEVKKYYLDQIFS